MSLSECCIRIDSHGQELTDHGTGAFPVACYQDDFHTMNVPWHWHPEWEAVCIVAGSCTVAAGQQKMKLQAGDGFFINSGVLHGCWDLEGTGCVFHSIVFHPRLIGGSLDSAMHLNYVLPLMENNALEWLPLYRSTPWQQEALDAIETAWQACLGNGPGYEFSVRSALSSLILEVWKNMPQAVTPAGKKALRDSSRIKTMLAYIHQNHSSDLTVSQIAAAVSVSESECLRCFRSAIGATPIQYLKQYRIQQAACLLISTGKPICDIAQQCGFQDMSYFTRSFRAQMHCTPSQYRKTERRSGSAQLDKAVSGTVTPAVPKNSNFL